LLADVRERIGTFLMEQVITAGGNFFCWWRCVGRDYVWWLGIFCIPPCPWLFAFLLIIHEFFLYCYIPPWEMHFLLVWDDDAEFCHMMHVNCGFLWIWMLDLVSVNLVISCLVLGCNPWWLPNPGWIQDAGGKQAAGYCRGGLHICNVR
jgi:hypothetical protein